jgi:5-methylcytosine-specific restriction endonuclease McrA
MAKYKFKQSERFAVWKTHGKKCFWCAEPLSLQETTVDHVLPESLLDKEEDLSRVKLLFGLGDKFNINGFENWVPAHQQCNGAKRDTIFKASEVMLAILERVAAKAPNALKHQKRIEENERIGEALSKVQVLYDENKITKEDLIAIFSDSDDQEHKLADELEKLILRVDPSWQIVSVDNDMATVTDGRVAGRTPVGNDVHPSWGCPNCGAYGPWSGARCLTCGMLSDGD